MINQTPGIVYNGQTTIPIQEDIIPNEGSSIQHDGRLYNLGEISPGSRLGLQSSGGILTRQARSGLDRPLGTHVQNYEGVQAGAVENYGSVDPTAGLSHKDAKLVEQHLPEFEQVQTTSPSYSSVVEQVVPENVVYTTQVVGTPQVVVSELNGAVPANTSTFLEVPAVNQSVMSASPLQRSRMELNYSEVSSLRYQKHQSFENWENNRNVFVTDRLNVMDDLLLGMEKRMEWLEAGNQKTIVFFKDRRSLIS